MSILLRDVRKENEGLVGITLRGKEIPIESQGFNVKRIKIVLENPDRNEYGRWVDEQMQEIAKNSGEGNYVHLVEVDPFGEYSSKKTVVFFYNLYRAKD